MQSSSQQSEVTVSLQGSVCLYGSANLKWDLTLPPEHGLFERIQNLALLDVDSLTGDSIYVVPDCIFEERTPRKVVEIWPVIWVEPV